MFTRSDVQKTEEVPEGIKMKDVHAAYFGRFPSLTQSRLRWAARQRL